MRAPVFAIVGRPNVGKSTLFNRIAGRPISIVEDVPGVTRDRIYAHARFFIDKEEGGAESVQTVLIDTGGFEPAPSDAIFSAVRQQTQLAIDEADVILFVVDGRQGVSPDDADVASHLRKSGRPVIVAANKVDSAKQQGLENAFFELGVDEVMPISAAHGRGIGDLLERAYQRLPKDLQEGARAAYEEATDDGSVDDDALEEALDAAEAQAEEDDGEEERQSVLPEVLRLAVVGKPNAGKSSLVNKLIGEERHAVSEIAGTTVDAIDSFFEHGGQRYRLIDTAGIRRKRSIAHKVEKLSVVSALKGLDRCDIALLMLDAGEGLTEQDMKVASFAEEKGKAVVIVVNKWDLAEQKKLEAQEYARQIRDTVPFLAHAPIRFVSAKTGKRVFDLLETARHLAEKHFLRVGTGEVNRVLRAAVEAHQPPMHAGKRVKLMYATQVRTAPPTFVVATNDPQGVHFSYRRFLENRFREHFDFGGAPLRLIFRKRSNKERAKAPSGVREKSKSKRGRSARR